MSNRILSFVLVSFLLGGAAFSQEAVMKREGEVPASSQFVPVTLDDYANDAQEITFTSARVTVKGVPFNLITKAGANNLFLKTAEWPDWKTDPTDYYAAYDSKPKEKDPRRPIFQIPVADYSEVYLLATAEDDKNLSQAVSFRLGTLDGASRTVLHDFSATVPRSSETKGDLVVKADLLKVGNLFLVRVPLGKAIAQDLLDRPCIDVEVTKELRLAIHRPDPCRFTYRPLGLPSGVHLFGMTFVRSPVQMEITSSEAGNVFNEPQVPTFEVVLRNTHLDGLSGQRCALVAEATDYYGNTTTLPEIPAAFNLWASTFATRIPLKVPRRGYYRLRISLKSGSTSFLARETTFAVLAPNTRKHRDEAPWGTWDFSGTHYTPHDPDIVGPLYVKAGLRYGMFGFSEEARRTYGVLVGNDPAVSDPKQVEEAVKQRKDKPELPAPPRYMIFHENCISGPHITRTPDLFTGRPPYKMEESEQKQFDTMFTNAEACCRLIRKEFPKTEIYFGNGACHLLEEFLRRKFPRELFDARGNEAGNFMRSPEAQPPDFVANNASLWMDRELLDHYGYKDVPLRQCYEICYPNTNPGNLSLQTQAAHFVRHLLHSRAWRIPILRVGSLTDMGNSYYYSNWGASGLCFAAPNVSPKPSYVAVAVMTQILDGAKLTRAVPSAAPTVYAVEFRKRDRTYVTCLWTPRGSRSMTIEGFGRGSLTDMMGNETSVRSSAGLANVTISPEPVYLTTTKPLARLVAGPVSLEGRPQDKRFLVSPLGKLSDWVVETGRDQELEMYDFDCPRRKGEFEYREVASFEGEDNVLGVKPRLPVSGSPYLPMYSVLRHTTGVEIPGEPTEIGLMVNGNGGWGRVLFELEDASGQRWISIGAEQSGEPTRWMADWMSEEQFKSLKTMNLCDWNTNDPWGRSALNFEGWRYLRFPLPGNYPGEGYHWPYSSQWRFSGDGLVKYPLKLKKLILTLPEKVLHLTRYAPVPRQEIYLKDLMVTYDPPEKAFVAE